jgi:acetyltransferase-like isoleucine patch superfamily enzyme
VILMNEKTNPYENPFENAQIGEGTIIEPNVQVGFRYHKDCRKAIIGSNGILRYGTIIYGDVVAGDYFQTGHYTIIRAMVEIGDYCTVTNHSTLEGMMRIGNAVRIMSHVYIASRTVIGDNVFIGPGVTFLNDKYPGREEIMAPPTGAVIEDEVSIGGCAIILPGVRIGKGSFIAAGALVNRHVPPYSLVMGVPGKITALPDKLNSPNNRTMTHQKMDLWHPSNPDARNVSWPDYMGRAPLEPEEIKS